MQMQVMQDKILLQEREIWFFPNAINQLDLALTKWHFEHRSQSYPKLKVSSFSFTT